MSSLVVGSRGWNMVVDATFYDLDGGIPVPTMDGMEYMSLHANWFVLNLFAFIWASSSNTLQQLYGD